MVSVHAYEFIIRWNHHCSFPFIVLYTYCLSVLHSVHQSFPVLLPVFHRIKVHSCSMYAIGVKGFEPSDHSLPKRVLYQTELHPVNNASVISCRITLTGTKRGPTSLPRGLDFRFFFLSETRARMYSSPFLFIITLVVSSVKWCPVLPSVLMDCPHS